MVRIPGFAPTGRGKLERANGVEPSHASLATMPRTMRARVFGSCCRICRPATSDLLARRSSERASQPNLVRTAGLAPAASEFQARLSAADLRPESGHADRSRTCLKSLCRRLPRAARPRRDVWGDRLDLHQLQRVHGPRAIYFAICHRIGTAGAIRTHKFLLLRELPLPDSATAA